MTPAKQSSLAANPALALYVHWPFCLSKCPYCDFNSHVAKTIDHGRWADALQQDLRHHATWAGKEGQPLSSVFFGGGTPSLMAPETMAAIIDTLRAIFPSSPDIEITMEANPTSVEADRLEAFRDAGVNRLSMGIQSLNDAALAYLGREHSATEARAALAKAQAIFPRVSADFIYARSHQRVEDWEDELEAILDLGLEHLSLYQLTLEPGTAFYSRHQRGLLDVPDADEGRRFYDLTQEKTDAGGCPAYEISNHAKPGQESRHNLIYWQSHDWLGIGPGAYGRFWRGGQRIESRNRRDPAAWLDDVMTHGHAIDQITEEQPEDFAQEALMMGLRLHQGVDLDRIIRIAGPIDAWGDARALDQMVDGGLLHRDGMTIKLTPDGRPLLNTILARLLAD